MLASMAVANALLNGVAAATGTSALDRHGRSDSLLEKWGHLSAQADPTRGASLDQTD
jgi:hypothetical protein